MRASALLVFATGLLVVACGNNANSPQPTAPTAGYAYPPPPGYPQQPVPGQPQSPPGYPAASYPPGYATAAPTYPPPASTPYAPAPAPPAATPYPATPAPTYAPPAPAAPAAPTPAATGTMATPGLLALPCQSDATCGLHRCNTQYGKCAFPCQSAASDCAPASQCVMGVCVPGTGS